MRFFFFLKIHSGSLSPCLHLPSGSVIELGVSKESRQRIPFGAKAAAFQRETFRAVLLLFWVAMSAASEEELQFLQELPIVIRDSMDALPLYADVLTCSLPGFGNSLAKS